MNEPQVTVVGNVATELDHRTTRSGEQAVRFRLAGTVRRFDRAREAWEDAWTSFFTVWAWRTLATNVAASVTLGEPVIVQGRLRVREGEKEGRRYVTADLLASSIGHDLNRGTAAFRRVSPARAGGGPTSGGTPQAVPGQTGAPAPEFGLP
ncbi:single-stranded DNA-binding protein [Streptomyces sp. RKND-216]|uniref:single-stranded DNA-binding protein n=1 Tax=Streptomyces sp. RKND-216 TaxID=2562581 RepID=UPI00109DD07A|nr:single-stranded DNA-binding protein [Streptomyces sp. RKND-216]THA26378.1 single-stranded DNA-binding protein [Streptomyces sp. RKND-216]